MTAVEWLIEKLHKRWYGLEEGDTWNDLIHQALEMEKQQIIDSYCDGRLSVINKQIILAEQYYNETYKKDNQ